MSDGPRDLVRVTRPNHRPLHPDGIGDLLYGEALTADPECIEIVVEIDREGVERLREQSGYVVDVVAEGVE